MKNTFICLLVLCSSGSYAQVILTLPSHGIGPGVTSSVYRADTTGFIPGPNGTSQTWDFSNLQTLGSAYTSNYVDPATTPYSSMYGGATVANGGGSSGYSYYVQSTTDLSLMGGGDGSSFVYYYDPIVLYVFPFTFGNTNVDGFTGYYSGFLRSGTMSLDADAYGTLILASGSFSALRVKSTESYVDTSTSSSVAVHVTVVTYNWYTATERFPVLQYTVATISGSSSGSAKQVLMNANVVGINEPEKENNFLKIYPNPATDRITAEFSLTDPKSTSIEIRNVLGESIEKTDHAFTNGINTTEVDISVLPPGLYFIQVKSAGSNYNEKFIKK